MRPPRGNVTFIFTDIERSSQLWETHPQTMGRALAQHDNLLRTVFAEHQGYIFKTAGDAFCVAFGQALDAVHAAHAAQRVLASAAWEDTGPLRVRMALHSGEAEQRDGDYFGQTLNRVARVLAAGHGGQTLLSRVTAERVREALPPEVSLRDLGERRLKDLSRPERIFQLIIRDLPADFPPLRSLEVLPNNLPAQVTTFVGRTREMADVKRLLGTTRLLTLTGPGGTGKTRLSLQVAADALDRFPHGVWLVELGMLSNPALVPEAIANAVEIREEHGRSILDTLVQALRTRHLLIVLDNCEHLIAACAQAAATLLRRCPELTILATSREALNIEGETIQPVPPLATESGWNTAGLAADQLAELEAVQLFVERAAAVRPGFVLTEENAELLARICWRLDGIPLAIELAAARVRVLTLEQIYARLDDRFRLLSGGSRTALPRQQTLGGLIDWSYDLLSEPERILLRRLAVFVAGRTLAMAEEVCAGEGLDRSAVFDLLSALVEKSLLTIEPALGEETRYTMLESVWDYGDQKLTQHGEGTRYRKKHLEYFVRLAEAVEPDLFGPGQKAGLEKLYADHHNLNAALRFSVESPDSIHLGLQLAGALTRYWEVRSYLAEGYEHFKTLLTQTATTGAPASRAKAEFGAGRLSWCQDRDRDARQHFRNAQALYQEVGDAEYLGNIEAQLGFIARAAGDNEAARTHFNAARAVADAHASARVMAMADNGLANLAAAEGDFATARRGMERSLVAARSLGDQWMVALVTARFGQVCHQDGDHAVAMKLMRESLKLSRELGNKWVMPYAIEVIAAILADANEALKAVQLYGAALAQREALALGFSVVERPAYEQAVKRLRELVPEEIFEREWAKGRSLSLPAAIELAMETEATASRPAGRNR